MIVSRAQAVIAAARPSPRDTRSGPTDGRRSRAAADNSGAGGPPGRPAPVAKLRPRAHESTVSPAAPDSSDRTWLTRCSRRAIRSSVIDDLSTGSMDNLAHLKGRPGFEYVIDTIMNEPLTAELIDRADVVFHLAAAVGVKLIVEAPVRTIETNVHGTEIVLKHGAKKGKLTMIFSTSEVYGKSDGRAVLARTRTS